MRIWLLKRKKEEKISSWLLAIGIMRRILTLSRIQQSSSQILYVGTITSTDYGKEGYKYRSKGHNSSYN